MKEQLQWNNRKYVSAEDIFNFLKSIAVNGFVNMTRQDIANHFNYKSGNGDGFRANMKMLEAEGLIKDVSKDKKHPIWKIDMESDFDFAAHPVISTRKKQNKEHGGVNMSKKEQIFNGVDFEQLHIINYMGRKYIQLMDITKALDIDRRPVYNAVTNSSKLVGPYIKSLPLSPGAQAKKAIELEGLTYLLPKLEKKVDSKKLKALKDYIELAEITSAYESKVESEESKNSSTVVCFPVTESINNDDNVIETDTTEDAILETRNLENTESNNSIDFNSDTDIESEQLSILDNPNSMEMSDVLSFLDGLTAILREHSEMKLTIEEKDNLILSLNNEIQELKNELSNQNNSSDIESLKKELLTTQKALSKTKEELSKVNILKAQILVKANQMKNYMIENNPMKSVSTH